MYNSVFVSVIIKIWEFINYEYNRSFLKKIVESFRKALSYLSNGSRVKSIFKSKDYLIEKSFIYKWYLSFMNFINKILDKIRSFIEKNGEYSIIYKNIKSLFSTKIEVFRTFFVFTLSFGVGLALNNIIRGYYAGRSYFVIAVIVFVSLLGISLKENYKQIFKNSLVWRFIYSIFSIEEELNRGN